MADWYRGQQLLIDGKLVTGRGPSLSVENPATEEVFTTVATSDADQVEAAIATARTSFDSGVWSDLPRDERVAILARMSDWLQSHRDELVETAITEVGSVRALAGLAQVDMSIDQSRQLPELFATLPEWEYNEAPLGDLITAKDVLLSMRSYEPVGVVVAITPYNFPLQTAVWKVFSALVTGCSVILRPSPLTPLTTFALAEAAHAAGLPSGVLNTVVETGVDGATRLTSDPRIDCVSFTGSTAVGRLIAEQAAPTVKRLVLELGGKSVQLYVPDSVDRVASGVGTVFFSHTGQACTAQTRVLVPESEVDNALAAICDMVATLPVGDPDDGGTIIGPVISAAQRQRIEDLLDAGMDAGAHLVVGGKRPAGLDRGYFIEPTVMRVFDNANPIAQQEAFGPVVTVQGYSNIDEAVSIANDSDYGLGGAVYSRDLPAGVAIARRIRSGTVHVNRGMPTAYTSTGGYKQSGVGRERGVLGLREYQETKHLVVGP